MFGLSKLFAPKNVRSAVLLDVSSGSIGGGYALFKDGALPELVYHTRLPIKLKMEELAEAAMERTLQELGNTLAREGAPALLRASGSGRADMIIAAISAPWQETMIRTEHFEDKKSFVFTKSLVERAMNKPAETRKGEVVIYQALVGTVLNGYETGDPYGKRVTRAAVSLLSSTIDKKVAESVLKTLNTLFHTRDITIVSGTASRYEAVRNAFPHERDYLILDACGPEIALALIRNKLLVATLDLKSVITSTARWPEEVRIALGDIAKGYPLPHTILMVAPEKDRAELKNALDASGLGPLWLSDESPTITAIAPEHLRALVTYKGADIPDLGLLLMTLYTNSVTERKTTGLSTSL